MVESRIKKVISNSGIGYCKMPDGTLIPWGSKLFSDEANESVDPPDEELIEPKKKFKMEV